jgi:hypothetical protein
MTNYVFLLEIRKATISGYIEPTVLILLYIEHCVIYIVKIVWISMSMFMSMLNVDIVQPICAHGNTEGHTLNI